MSIRDVDVAGPIAGLLGATPARIAFTGSPLKWVGMRPAERGVSRFQGTALINGEERAWSLILKVQRRVDEADDPSAWNYWKREFLAYRSGLLADLPGIAAPRCFGAIESSGEVLLWLEDIHEALTGPWPLRRYIDAARALGEFNGAYLADRRLPGERLLTRTYLRSWTGWIPWQSAIRAEATWSYPLVAAAFPRPPIDHLLRLDHDAAAWFDALDREPRTLAHLDAWRANLIGQRLPDGRERTVAVDWSFVGQAPAGQDLAIMVAGSHVWLDADPRDLDELSAAALDAYLEGLRAAGWRGDDRSIRFAYAASAALYALPMVPVWLARMSDPARRDWLERKCGRPTEEVVAGWALLVAHLLRLADEADRLRRA